MARNDKRIDQLTPSTIPLTNTDLFAIYNANGTRNETLGSITSYVATNMTGVTSDTYVTGGTLNVNTLELGRNQGLPTISVDLSSLITSNDTYVTGVTFDGSNVTISRNQGLSDITIDLSSLSNSPWSAGTGNFSATIAGSGSVSSADYSVSQGYRVIANGLYSNGHGSNNSVSGNSSNVGGDSNQTLSHYSSIVGGQGNLIKQLSAYGFIGGGLNNTINNAPPANENLYATILNGQSNFIDHRANYSQILNGNNNIISGDSNASQYSMIIQGKDNLIIDTVGDKSLDHTAIVSGNNNMISGHTSHSMILHGEYNLIKEGPNATTTYALIGGVNNTINQSTRSVILGSSDTNIDNSVSATILGTGDGSYIVGSSYSGLYSVDGAWIDGGGSGYGNVIIGGNGGSTGHGENVLLGTSGSVIIGGDGITGTSSETVYVPNLNINTTLSNDDSLTQVLVRANNGTVKYKDSSSFSEPFTGNTSGDCITDLYVSNINSCSPLNILPNREGDINMFNDGVVIRYTSGGTFFGVNTVTPNYAGHITGDVYVSGNMSIGGTTPDSDHRFRVTTDDNDGKDMTGIRVDMSHENAGVGNNNNFSGIQIRKTTPTTYSGITTLYGINSNLTPSVSGGSHTIIAGRFRAASTNGGGTNYNYALQLQDGTEGTAGHVWTSTDTTGLGHWVDPNTLIGGTSKYADNVPMTGGTVETVTHSLGTTDITVQVKDSSGTLIIPDVVNNYQNNSVDIEVSSTETYRVIIIG